MVVFDLFRLELEESKKKSINFLFIISVWVSERFFFIMFCFRVRFYRLIVISFCVLIKFCFNKIKYIYE